MVRKGRVLSAPHFVRAGGPSTPVDDGLFEQWATFDLAGALRRRLGKPTRVANDADLQGTRVVKGARSRVRDHARHRRGDRQLLRGPDPPALGTRTLR